MGTQTCRNQGVYKPVDNRSKARHQI
ncbi:hypothetical protein CT19425_U460013 [Cupriavidus taiwanensis]|uniref:Uncharacterized protein n=1 Tax=Cupriavidus taiwanensis TaxID=164546 RepID=A0A375I643_9BURK|nr:hypothetical protein CT19425_U460013 [Cupriavidus taiwanensis]